MSINKEVFAQLLGELQTYYKREFTPFVQRTWYKFLSDRLTTEEFVQAVEGAVVKNEFMPTPEQLVSNIKGDSEGNALVAWDHVIRAAAASDRSILQDLSPQASFALNSVGGLWGLGQMDADKLNWTKKEFLSAWKSWIPSLQNALPSADDSPVFFERAADPEAVQHMRALVEKMSATQPRQSQDTQKQNLPAAVTPDVGSASAIAEELRDVVEEAVQKGASRAELSFAISDAITTCGGKADEIRAIIHAVESTEAAKAIKDYYSQQKAVSASLNGKGNEQHQQ